MEFTQVFYHLTFQISILYYMDISTLARSPRSGIYPIIITRGPTIAVGFPINYDDASLFLVAPSALHIFVLLFIALPRIPNMPVAR